MHTACTTQGSGTGDESEHIESASQAFRVDDPALACGTPNPNLGENLETSGAGAELQEWTDSIDAMPASATRRARRHRTG